MELRLNIEDATPEELARGIAAAEAVFARAGITTLQGAEGLFALEGWDIKGFPEDDKPTEDEDRAAAVWLEADGDYRLHCFSDAESAQAFLDHFEGLRFDPKRDRENGKVRGVWRRAGEYRRVLDLGPLSVPEILRS
ncbi:hypothetical protein LB577_04930 [Mesorhizobium sp. B283B1A]|uniref:hypothetical protein n=1 Tax=Mesorhizobium TaxID=68287 RepID=UPI001CD045CE|nr:MULTISPECIES: hypothetical protein [Mesorhizobium]MCA0046298.1 hypothetical protein [Mesorhizobium sp. B283B1A]UQS62786.1 hypothetical protein M5D98_21855 [Mesorhizobium opportunistum]